MRIEEDSWLVTRPIAHRGLHDEKCPENTLPAFAAAADQGYPMELDVQMTRDGELCILHDWDIARATGKAGSPGDFTAAELSRLKVFGSSSSIPVLQEVLETVNGRTPLLIEIKSREMPGVLERKLGELLAGYAGDFAVESFNPLSLLAMNSWRKQLGFAAGQLSYLFDEYKMPGPGKWILRDCRASFAVRPDFIAYDITALPRKSVDRLRKRGIKLLGWTVQSEKDRRFAEASCDNYIFEYIRP